MVAEGQNFLLERLVDRDAAGHRHRRRRDRLSLVGDGLADRMGERFRLTV